MQITQKKKKKKKDKAKFPPFFSADTQTPLSRLFIYPRFSATERETKKKKKKKKRAKKKAACNVSSTLVSAIAQPKLLESHSSSPSLSLSQSNNPNPKLRFISTSSPRLAHNNLIARRRSSPPRPPHFLVLGSAKSEPLRVMISGAPASGKGTQCHLIAHKYGLVHIAAGDLLRAEIAAGSENGRRAKEFMEKGQLVPDEIVVMMVKERLSQPDSCEKGWLLDGYPRSSSQAIALKEFGFEPDIFILLEVPEDILVERVVGRRLDPVTGKIYHLKYSPPESEEIASRLTQRFDDTEEKVKLRLQTHNQNVEAVLSLYEDITIKIKGNVPKEDVFAQIDSALENLCQRRKAASGSLAA